MRIKIYMLCEPKFSLPFDFDTSLRRLCLRQGINYGTARNNLVKTDISRLGNGFLLERVSIQDKFRYPNKFFDEV